MVEKWKWNDLHTFLSVARAGGLTGAMVQTNMSAPTLGRRVASLERDLGVSLFEKRRDGYDLTPKGKELLARAEEMECSALKVDRWLAAADIHPVVKITAGEWTSKFISRHIELINDDEDLNIEISTGVVDADLMRREANLGIRNRRPERLGLAGRRLARVEFAVYGGNAFVQNRPEAFSDQKFDECNWVMFVPPGPKTPSAIWLDRHLGREAKLKCSTAHAVLDAVQAGAGLCVLPCFIGDEESELVKVSGLIGELGHDQWLVSHDDDRHNNHIRRISRKLAKLFISSEALFNGRQTN